MQPNLSTDNTPKPAFRLLVASPFYEIKGYSPYISAWTQTIKALDMTGIEWDYKELSGDSYVSRAKNSLVQDFLNSDFTHIFMIDSDLGWELEGFLKVVKAGMEGAEIVGATYPNKNTWESYGVVPVLQDGRPIIKTFDNIKVMQVHLLPGGFILYSRKAFERVQPNLDRYVNPKTIEEFYQYFKWMVQKSTFTGKADNYVNHIKRSFALALTEFGDYLGPNPDDIFLECFRCNIEKTGTLVGEDYYFQHRFREMGGVIWCIPDVSMAHYGVKEWTGNYWDFVKRTYETETPQLNKEQWEGLKDVIQNIEKSNTICQPVKISNNEKPMILIDNFACCIPDLREYFDIANSLDDVDKIKAAIFWNDELEDKRMIIPALKEKNIPTFVMAHGAVCAKPQIYDDTVGEKLGHQVIADYYLVWTDHVHKLVEAKGGKAITVGAPILKKVFHVMDRKTVTYFPSHIHDEKSKSVWKKLVGMDKIAPVAKLLTGEHNLSNFIGSIVISDRFNQPERHIDMIYKSLFSSSCMVTDIAGSEIVIAAYLGIPIIKIKNQYKNYHPEFITEVSLEELEEAIRFAIANPNHNGAKRREFVESYDKGDCAANIYNAIMGVINAS